MRDCVCELAGINDENESTQSHKSKKKKENKKADFPPRLILRH